MYRVYESNSTIGAKNLLIVVAFFFHQKKLEIQKAHTLHYILSALLLCATCVVGAVAAAAAEVR